METKKFTIDPDKDLGIIRRKAITRKMEMRRYGWLVYSLVIIILDQLSKWAVTEMILRPRLSGQNGTSFFGWYFTPPAPLPYIGLEITSFFNIVMVWNTGVSFGIFGGYGQFMPYILIVVSLLITGFFIVWLLDTKDPVKGICFAIIIGGALGNVIDRARFGGVIDFLDFHIFGYHWPAFNIADMAVVTGIGMLIVTSLAFDIKRKRRYRNREKRQRRAILYRR